MKSLIKSGLLFLAGVMFTLLLVLDRSPVRSWIEQGASRSDQVRLLADEGRQANLLLARLRGKQGRVTLRGGGDIRTTIRLGVGQVLEFGPGTWRCSASPCIELKNASQVKGAGVYRTRLELADRSVGPILRSDDFVRLSGLSEVEALQDVKGLPGDGKQLPGVKYVKVSDLTLDGRKGAQTAISNGIEIYGYWFRLEDISIERFSGDGLLTQFIPGAGVKHHANDAMESYISRVKLISNAGNGWIVRGPHDSVATGVIALNNGEWGIDVQHREGFYSGGGLMLSNTHLYSNRNGLRTEAGANIVASGLESEANLGIGLLLRSNDSIIQGIFYANGTYGIQLGDDGAYAGANVLTVQLHNNAKAQVYWHSSAGYNQLAGTIFPNESSQKYFESAPTRFDQVLSVGPHAVQYFPGGLMFDSDRNIYGGRLK